MKKRSRQIWIQIPGFENEADVTFNFYEGCAARYYLSNGDPGYPAEPPEAEILSVTIDGAPVELSDDQYENLQEAVIEKYSEQLADDERDYREDI